MRQQGAGLEPSTFEPEARSAIDCAAKACSCHSVDFRFPLFRERVSTSYWNALTGQAHALSWMRGPITSDTNVMKQARSRSRTFDLLARGRMSLLAARAKACSCGGVEFRAYKPRVVTVCKLLTTQKM
jgi:hypothetical protein